MALEAFARQRGLFLSPTGLKTLMSDLFGRKLDALREAQREGKSLLEVVANYEDEEDASLPPPATSGRPRRWLRPAAVAAGLALLLGVGIALRPRHHATPPPVVQSPVATTTPATRRSGACARACAVPVGERLRQGGDTPARRAA